MSHVSRPVRAKQPDREWCIAALVSGFALTGRYCPTPFSVGVAYSYICICPFRAIYSLRGYDFFRCQTLDTYSCHLIDRRLVGPFINPNQSNDRLGFNLCSGLLSLVWQPYSASGDFSIFFFKTIC